MFLKSFIFAVAVGVASASQCGVPAVRSVAAKGTLLDVLAGKSHGRIVGGTEATPHSFPWQVALFIHDQFWCGGSIISEKFVLTAAHSCHSRLSASQLFVKVGAHSLTKPGPNTKTVAVKTMHVHPGYPGQNLKNDLCLLELAEPLVFNEHVSPVCLGDATDGLPDQTCTISGWGSVQQRDGADLSPKPRIIPDALQQVDLPIVEQEVCKKFYGTGEFINEITSDMICVYKATKSGCNGDSGGPLVCQSGPGAPFKLVGAASWVYGCADSTGQFPTVYARTFTARDWIASITHI